jgi:hypothetical protein
MSRIVKDFDSFSSSDHLNEMWGLDAIEGMLGKVLPVLGEGFTKTLKQKVAAAMMEKFGIMPDSDMSAMLQEVVDAIPVADLPEILMGKKTGGAYWSPIMSQAIQEYVQRKGIDHIFTKIGIKPDGWIGSTLRESLQSQLGKEKLQKMIAFAFDDVSSKDSTSIGATALDSLDPAQKDKFNDAFSRAAGQTRPTYSTYADDSEKPVDQHRSDSSSGGGIIDTITSLFSGNKNNDQ